MDDMKGDKDKPDTDDKGMGKMCPTCGQPMSGMGMGHPKGGKVLGDWGTMAPKRGWAGEK